MMKTDHLTEDPDPILRFQLLCSNIANGFDPKNRFLCMDRLERAVQKKKGAYTEEDRHTWLEIIYACLEAPDRFFTQYDGSLQEKKIEKYERKRKKFQSSLKLERARNSSICTYVDCIRGYLKKIERETVSKNRSILAKIFLDRMKAALLRRTERYPELKKCNNAYQDTLKRIFQEKDFRLDHPAYFMLLPYLVFFELAKCEKLISDQEPFKVLNLNQREQIWTVRNSPIQIHNSSDLKRVQTLYELVERTLCKALRDQDYNSIGLAAWKTIDKYEMTDFDIACKYFNIQMEPLNDEEIRQIWETDAVFFSAPFWDQSRWSARFYKAFALDPGSLDNDLSRLFSLSFRPRTRQSANEIEKIYKRYQEFQVELEGRRFCLSKLMVALSNIYSPCLFFDHKDPLAHDLCDAVDLLTDFLDAGQYLFDERTTDDIDRECPEMFDDDNDDDDREEDGKDENHSQDIDQEEREPAEIEWMCLLQNGYPVDKYEFSLTLPNDFLVDPSRELVKALILRAISSSQEDYCKGSPKVQTYLLEETLYGSDRAYYSSMGMIQKAMHKAITSPQRISRDISRWGRVKIEVDHSASFGAALAEAFSIWGFWHPERMAVYLQIASYLKQKPDCLSRLVEDMSKSVPKKVKLDLTEMNFCISDFKATKRLSERRKLLVSYFPKSIQKLLGDPDELDDCQYAMLLYIVFHALRERMCRQAYRLSLRLLPFA